MTDQMQEITEKENNSSKLSRTIWDDLAPGANIVEISVGSPAHVAAMERAGVPLAQSVGNILDAVAKGLAANRPDIAIQPQSARLSLLSGDRMGAVAVFFKKAAGETGPVDFGAAALKAQLAVTNNAAPQPVSARSLPVWRARVAPKVTAPVLV